MKLADLDILHSPSATSPSAFPPLLFIHGAYCSASCWQVHLMPWLAQQGLDCYAVSLPGHGNSHTEQALPFLSMDDYAAAVELVIESLPQAPILVGHSLGGAVVQQVLEKHSLPGAILLASVPPSGLAASSLRVIGQQPDVWWELLQLQWGMLDQQSLHILRKALFTDHLPESTLLSYVPMFQPESTRALWDLSMSGWFPKASLAHIPALVIGATQDALFTEKEVARTAERFGVSPMMIQDMGHAMMLEHNWELLAHQMLSWLQTTFSPLTNNNPI